MCLRTGGVATEVARRRGGGRRWEATAAPGRWACPLRSPAPGAARGAGRAGAGAPGARWGRPMQVTLPDGNPLELPDGAAGAAAAAAIGPGLARAALAVRVDGDLRDLARPLADGEPIEIVTARSDDALALIRHDAAHVLATAVMELYPGVKISIGPPIEQGFYYDFDFPEGTHVSEADFAAIEAKMAEHVKAEEPVVP